VPNCDAELLKNFVRGRDCPGEGATTERTASAYNRPHRVAGTTNCGVRGAPVHQQLPRATCSRLASDAGSQSASVMPFSGISSRWDGNAVHLALSHNTPPAHAEYQRRLPMRFNQSRKATGSVARPQSPSSPTASHRRGGRAGAGRPPSTSPRRVPLVL
jgi:hypothetical protein